MLEVRVALSEPWVIGTAVRVELPQSDSHSGVAIPRDALVLRQEGTFVFRIDDEGQAERVAVSTGIGHGSLIEVKGEIVEGDRVVVRGAERLRPGQPVTIDETPL
jgi:multidrug efflux pump subunit AcrA (membrane-fusion protein)